MKEKKGKGEGWAENPNGEITRETFIGEDEE